jgi:hypothetical protein
MRNFSSFYIFRFLTGEIERSEMHSRVKVRGHEESPFYKGGIKGGLKSDVPLPLGEKGVVVAVIYCPDLQVGVK